MSGEQESKAVFLSSKLYSKIESRVKDTGFSSVDEYIVFVMEEVLRDEGQEKSTFSREEEEEVKKRLKALGYLE